jgi:hypothetical protein
MQYTCALATGVGIHIFTHHLILYIIEFSCVISYSDGKYILLSAQAIDCHATSLTQQSFVHVPSQDMHAWLLPYADLHITTKI